METPGFQALLQNMQLMFTAECKKLAEMGRETADNVNVIKKDNIIIHQRLDRMERILEERGGHSQREYHILESNTVGNLTKSSSLNSITHIEKTRVEYISLLKKKLSVPKFIITLPKDIKKFVSSLLELTGLECLRQLKFSVRAFRKNDVEVNELVFTDQTERDHCHELLSGRFESMVQELDYKLTTVTFTPKLKVVGLSPESEDRHIVVDIMAQNTWITQGDISLLRSYRIKKQKDTSTTVILNVFNDEVFKQLIADKTIMVQRRNCRVYEFIQDDTCIICLRKGHKSSTCNNSAKCKLCAEEHSTKTCTSNIKRCIRCIRANRKKENVLFPTNHNSMSPKCPSYAQELRKIKEELEEQLVNFQEVPRTEIIIRDALHR